MKRICILGFALLFVALAACAPTPAPSTTLVPTPATTMPASTMTPVATPPASASPTTTPMVTAPATTAPAGSPGVSSGTATGTMTIKDFKEGTAVMATDVPSIKTAFDAMYAGATIKSIKHSMHENAQAYVIEYTAGKDGKVSTVYIRPDGTWFTASTSTPTTTKKP